MESIAYAYTKSLTGATFEQAMARVKEALEAEGFGVLTEIDVKGTLEKKLGVAFRRYTILGACNPRLAHRALEIEPEIGLLLPCNVVVQETPESGVSVSIANPLSMFQVVDNTALEPVAEEADRRLQRVVEGL